MENVFHALTNTALVCGSQAWAVASGKINEFPNDKARWKTNFRCALNNLYKRFKMTKDNSKNLDDPHKIYEIVNTECKTPNPGHLSISTVR